MYDYRVAEHGWHGKAANVALTHVTKNLTNRWKSIATRTTKMVSNKMIMSRMQLYTRKRLIVAYVHSTCACLSK